MEELAPIFEKVNYESVRGKVLRTEHNVTLDQAERRCVEMCSSGRHGKNVVVVDAATENRILWAQRGLDGHVSMIPCSPDAMSTKESDGVDFESNKGGHTPGPWHLIPRRSKSAPPKIGARRRAIVAVVVTSSCKSAVEVDANCDLIVSAPDLLAALEDSIESLEAIADELPEFHHSARADSLRVIARKHRAAIAKARGGDSPNVNDLIAVNDENAEDPAAEEPNQTTDEHPDLVE